MKAPPLPLGAIYRLPTDVQSLLFSFFDEVEIALFSVTTSLGGNERVVYQRRLKELGAGDVPLQECTLQRVEEVSVQILCEIQTSFLFLSKHAQDQSKGCQRSKSLWARQSVDKEIQRKCKKSPKSLQERLLLSASSSLLHLRLLESALLTKDDLRRFLRYDDTALCTNWIDSLQRKTAREETNHSHIELSIPQSNISKRTYLSYLMTTCSESWKNGRPFSALSLQDTSFFEQVKNSLLMQLNLMTNTKGKEYLLTNLLSVAPLDLLTELPEQEFSPDCRERVGLAWHARCALHQGERVTSTKGLLQQAAEATSRLDVSRLSKTNERANAAFSLRQILTRKQWHQEELKTRLSAIISRLLTTSEEAEKSPEELQILYHVLVTLLIVCKENRVDIAHVFFAQGGAQILRPLSDKEILSNFWYVHYIPTYGNILAATIFAGSPQLFGLILKHIKGIENEQNVQQKLFSAFSFAKTTGQLPRLFQEAQSHAPKIATLISKYQKILKYTELAKRTLYEDFGMSLRSDSQDPLLHLEHCSG